MSGVPLADQTKERPPTGSHADLPGDRVRCFTLRPYPSCMNAAEMVPGAERDAVPAVVAAPARAEDEMVVVEIPPRRADGHRAAPAVTRENRVAVARLALPLGLHVAEE